MISKIGVKYAGVHVGKLRRYFSFQNFVDLFKVPVGFFQSLKVLRDFRPDVVFSKGGYVSVPVVFASKLLGVPVVVHESDVSVGLANKMAFTVAKRICLSFVETKKYLGKRLLKKVVVTGSPIRDLRGDSSSGLKFCGFDKHRPVLLVMGGSQGANQINKLVEENIYELLKKFQIVHVRGKGNLNIGLNYPGYKQFEYIDKELFDVYAASDLVVTRGGANSLLELASLKKKVLVIPLATGRGEQKLNAKALSGKFGWSVLSGNISNEEFLSSVMMTARNKLNSGASVENGTKQIVDLILKEGE